MNNYIICIPTFRRYSIINKLTLNMLTENNINPNLIKIFVVEEEKELYQSVILDKYEIIVGKKGLVQQREFIENYFPIGTNIIFLDDDIKKVDLTLMNDINSLDEFFNMAFNEAITNKCYIWSIYPVFNKYYREKRDRLSKCLNICIGAFYGIINRPNDDELKIKVTRSGDKEDVERTILYYKKDGLIHRYNRIGFETKYYGSIGGLGTLKERLPFIIERTNDLLLEYSTYGKLKIRKNGIYEFVLNKMKEFIPLNIINNNLPVQVLNKINPEEFVELYNMLEEINIPFKNGKSSRHGFPKHRAVMFGYTRQRYSGKVCLSLFSKKYPYIYHELNRIGKLICPFDYTSIFINHNVVCPKHKDSKNIDKSLLVSFGDYTGCNIVVQDVEYNTNCSPIIFNGALLEHYNTNDLKGNKYSLIYYSIPYKIT